jgi:hypothetical protein
VIETANGEQMDRFESRRSAAGWRTILLSVAVMVTCGLLVACSSMPPSPYGPDAEPPDLMPGVNDDRGRFREVFCAVLEEDPDGLPDARPCDEAITVVGPQPAGTGQVVDLGHSDRRLVAAIVQGLGWDCFSGWLGIEDSIGEHLRESGFDWTVIPVESLSSSERNAELIRDAVMAMELDGDRPRLVLIGYSKGAPDILAAIVSYPEIRDRIAAVVGVAGAVEGSPAADGISQSTLEMLRLLPKAECPKGDRGSIESLRPAIREAWLDENTLPAEIPTYSLATCPEPDRISKILKSSYKKLAKIDPRNDGMMLVVDQFIPSSSFLGCVNADHWAVAVPIARTGPKVAKRYVNHNDYPREALFEAILRFVEEDLDD